MPDNFTNPGKPESDSHAASNEAGGRKSYWWIWAIVIVVLLGGYAYHQRQEAMAAKASAMPAPRAVPIQSATAHAGDIGVYINALGTVTPVYTVTVTSRVQGEITNVYYREGQIVRKGDPLLDIDPRPYQAALTQAEGQLAHDQAVLNKDKIDMDRYQLAFNRNAIAKQQLDDQQQTVLQDEGTVKNDQGSLDNAKVNLVYCHITSPIAGRVGLRLVDPGNIVQANSTTSLVVVTQLQPITVIFSVAEDYLPQIQQELRAGHRLDVIAFDHDQLKKIANGSLLTLDNIIDTTTGTVKLKAIFPNGDAALFPNQFVNARLTVTTLQNAVLVPNAAIQRNAQGAFVYVIQPDQTAAIKTVTTGPADTESTSVQGIKVGDVVAINGFDKLQDGAKVAVRNRNADGSGSGGGNSGGGAGGDGGRGNGSGGGSGNSGGTQGR
ncbi:MAG: efflux RND transporter periplasmic adaptor subunit [Candidatus Acidiferrales bacterium]